MFKWRVLLLGIAVGSYWSVIFSAYLPFILISAAILLAYVAYVWWRQ